MGRTRDLLSFLALLTLILAQSATSEPNPENFIEDISENYTLKVERSDGSVDIKVFTNDQRLFQSTITTENFREKVGTNLANLAHLFEIFKEKSAYEIQDGGKQILMKTFLTIGTLTIPQETVIFLVEGVIQKDEKLALQLSSISVEIRDQLKSQFELLKDDLLKSLGIVRAPSEDGENQPLTIDQFYDGVHDPNDYVLFSVFRNTFNFLDNKIKKNTLQVIEELQTLKEEIKEHYP